MTARKRAHISNLRPMSARSSGIHALSIPGSDVLLLFCAVALALSVFELAAWLAAAPLSALVFSVVLVPLALLFTVVVSGRDR